MGNTGITIKKANNDIYYSVGGDSGRYFELESVTIAHPELREYIEDNRIMLNRKMMQFREGYDSSSPLSLFE